MEKPPIIDLRNTERRMSAEAATEKTATELARPAAKAAPSTNEPILLSWSAPEFPKYEKDGAWIRNALIIFGVFALILLLTKNFLGAMLMVIAGIIFVLNAVKEPRILPFGISEHGVYIGSKIHLFRIFESFWIFNEPESPKEISFRPKQMLMQLLKVPLDGQDAASVREILLKFLPEVEQQESSFDVIARRLRF